MRKTIISGFPGIGKTHIFKNNPNFVKATVETNKEDIDPSKTVILDSDSSTFDKANFPQNYINHIKSWIESDLNVILLVSSHIEVRRALQDNNLDYVLVKPEISLKEEYLKRYEERGSTQGFISLLSDNWDSFNKTGDDEQVIELGSGQFLSDVIMDIYRV